jgi:hypothetical protein
MSAIARDRYIVVSADGHAGAELPAYREYLERRYRDDFDAWVSGFQNPFSDLRRPDAERNWDSQRRQRELEADGVVGEVLFPNNSAVLPERPGVPDYDPAKRSGRAGA